MAAVGKCQPLLPSPPGPRPGFTHPHPHRASPLTFAQTQNREGTVQGPGETAGTQTQAVPTGLSGKRQAHEQVSIR